MTEAIFIVVILLGLLAWTAFRYRKQIVGIIGFAKMIKEVKDGLTGTPSLHPRQSAKGIPLVNCSNCGIWVPQNKARKVGDLFYCSDECLV